LVFIKSFRLVKNELSSAIFFTSFINPFIVPIKPAPTSNVLTPPILSTKPVTTLSAAVPISTIPLIKSELTTVAENF